MPRQEDLASLLVEFGASLLATDRDGSAPLSLALAHHPEHRLLHGLLRSRVVHQLQRELHAAARAPAGGEGTCARMQCAATHGSALRHTASPCPATPCHALPRTLWRSVLPARARMFVSRVLKFKTWPRRNRR